MNTKFKTTAIFFRQKRLKVKLNQEFVAKQLGYETSQMISNWERGICLPPNDKLPNLVELYKIPRKEILNLYMAETQKQVLKYLKKS